MTSDPHSAWARASGDALTIDELRERLEASEKTLRRLLILNDYGFTVEHHSDGPKPSEAGASFLSDEFLTSWYGKDSLPDYVWADLREVGDV